MKDIYQKKVEEFLLVGCTTPQEVIDRIFELGVISIPRANEIVIKKLYEERKANKASNVKCIDIINDLAEEFCYSDTNIKRIIYGYNLRNIKESK